MLQTVQYGDMIFPSYQVQGRLFRFLFPVLQEICSGEGYDVTHSKTTLLGAIHVKPHESLPDKKVQYICSDYLAYAENWKSTLQVWLQHITENGVLAFSIPSSNSISMYIDIPTPYVINPLNITKELQRLGCRIIFVSGEDINNQILFIVRKE